MMSVFAYRFSACLGVQQKELERLRNSVYILGQELADQQQRLDKGVSCAVL